MGCTSAADPPPVKVASFPHDPATHSDLMDLATKAFDLNTALGLETSFFDFPVHIWKEAIAVAKGSNTKPTRTTANYLRSIARGLFERGFTPPVAGSAPAPTTTRTFAPRLNRYDEQNARIAKMMQEREAQERQREIEHAG